MNGWLIFGAFYAACAVIVFVAILASCVKAAEADERLRDEWRDDEGRAA